MIDIQASVTGEMAMSDFFYLKFSFDIQKDPPVNYWSPYLTSNTCLRCLKVINDDMCRKNLLNTRVEEIGKIYSFTREDIILIGTIFNSMN